eukprot:1772173-Pyramimonas_sp.AAC.1
MVTRMCDVPSSARWARVDVTTSAPKSTWTAIVPKKWAEPAMLVPRMAPVLALASWAADVPGQHLAENVLTIV